MFFRFADNASLEASEITNGRSLLKCAFAAIHTAVSVIPLAIFAKVFPVHGEMINPSSGLRGPNGSASTTVWIACLWQMVSVFSISSFAVPKRVSVVQTVSLKIGWIS